MAAAGIRLGAVEDLWPIGAVAFADVTSRSTRACPQRRAAPREARHRPSPAHRSHRPGKLTGKPAPGQLGLSKHRRHRALAEKGDRARRVPTHLGLESEPSCHEFHRRDLISPPSGLSTTAVMPQAIGEEAPFLVGLEASVGEAGEMQRGPEAIAAVGEIMSAVAAVVAGLMPQNTTSRSSARTSGSYVAKAAPVICRRRAPGVRVTPICEEATGHAPPLSFLYR